MPAQPVSSSPEAQPVVNSGPAHVQQPSSGLAHYHGPTRPSNPLGPVRISKAQSGLILPQQPNSPAKFLIFLFFYLQNHPSTSRTSKMSVLGLRG
ncbi:hypothetical protein CRG98_043244 [Punica granatum]|uniref:Uncharacterized protein n=1 Tax=Punica granatum TaxID=22663 RepID=A0A2I0HXV6_PUNGR|nr:hypothetical protein CRG98_043244 [Punica granatum]